ncbi:MAG: HPr family phosphocarrier protein [Lentisphaeria bacterium]
MGNGNSETRLIKVQNQLGMHARPASMFAKKANEFKANVTVEKDGNVINGKSIMGLMMLAAEEGSSLTVRAEGDDAVEVLDALEQLFRDKFGEE